MDSFSFKIYLQVLVTFVICMLVIIGIIRDGDKNEFIYSNISYLGDIYQPSLLLTFRTWNSELWCWNNNKYRPVIYNHLCNGEEGISLHR